MSVAFDVVGVDAVGIAVSVGADVVGVRCDAVDGCVCEASICIDSVGGVVVVVVIDNILDDALTFEWSVDAVNDATTVSLFTNVAELLIGTVSATNDFVDIFGFGLVSGNRL